MLNDKQKDYLVEILGELEAQIMAGEYYSYTPRCFVEYVKEAEELFGITYAFNDGDWRKEDGKVVHKHDSYFRKW